MFTKAQLITLESAFDAVCGLDPYYLQKPNDGEGYWMATTQDAFVAWLAKVSAVAVEHILEQRISETAYNVKLADTGYKYVVTYGKQVEHYPHTPQGLIQASQEYISCVDHCIKLEKLS